MSVESFERNLNVSIFVAMVFECLFMKYYCLDIVFTSSDYFITDKLLRISLVIRLVIVKQFFPVPEKFDEV